MTEPREAPSPRRTGAPAIEAVVGLQLVVRLHGLLRSVRLYDLSNQAVRDQVREFLELLDKLMDGDVTLVAMGQCFYVNGTRLRAQPSHSAVFDNLTREFEQRRLGGARFLEGLRPDEMSAFLRLMVEHPDAARAERLAEAVAAAGVVHVALVTLEEVEALGTDQSDPEHSGEGERQRARETLTRAVAGTKAAILRTARTGRPAIRGVKRVIQPIVDTIMKDEHSIVGLTAIKRHDEYTYAHCVNVSTLSVAMGQMLGLSRPMLANLGVAALLHDVGKLTIPPEVLRKADSLDEREWGMIHRHPIEGFRMAIRMPGLSSTTLDLMEVCLHHHLMMDGSGYPPIGRRWRLSTFSRIVSVADCFDAMTAHRAYRARPFTGYEALQVLLGPDARHFDRAALWALVKSVGLYPAGSLLETSTGHLVVSLSSNPNDVRRPHCRVFARPDGSMPLDADPETWDPMPSDVKVLRVVSPDDFELDVDQLLAA